MTQGVLDKRLRNRGDRTGAQGGGPTLGAVARFIAGARIATANGPIAVEALRPGDRILTLDHGYQTLRSAARHVAASQGACAAISIPADTFGLHGALRVSPQHRILLTGWQAEMFCGEVEVMVKAAHLVRAGLLRQDHSGCEVTYYQLLFDQPEVLRAEGLWGDSCLPGAQIIDRPDDHVLPGLDGLLPELPV